MRMMTLVRVVADSARPADGGRGEGKVVGLTSSSPRTKGVIASDNSDRGSSDTVCFERIDTLFIRTVMESSL